MLAYTLLSRSLLGHASYRDVGRNLVVVNRKPRLQFTAREKQPNLVPTTELLVHHLLQLVDSQVARNSLEDKVLLPWNSNPNLRDFDFLWNFHFLSLLHVAFQERPRLVNAGYWDAVWVPPLVVAERQRAVTRNQIVRFQQRKCVLCRCLARATDYHPHLGVALRASVPKVLSPALELLDRDLAVVCRRLFNAVAVELLVYQALNFGVVEEGDGAGTSMRLRGSALLRLVGIACDAAHFLFLFAII